MDTTLVRLAPIPDLEVTSITTNATERDLFQPFQVDWVVENVGTGPTNASYWRDYVYLSPDPTLDPTDIKLGEFSNPAFLNDGEAYSQSATVSARGNISEGDYYILVLADGRDDVEEHFNEGDNLAVGPQIHISFPPPPDLVVSNVVAPETALSGQRMTLTYTVENQGDASAFSRWDDAVYMSEDEVLDASDRLLANVPYQTQYQIFRTVSYTGDYEACFGEPTPEPVTDVFFVGSDFDSSYRYYTDLLRYNSPSDLCTVYNGLGQPTVTVSRITDYTFDSIQHFLDVGQTYTRSVGVNLPIGVSGDFYFFVRADVSDRVNEYAFDTNNDNYDETPTTVILTPPPDLEVLSVNVVESVVQAGRSATLQYPSRTSGPHGFRIPAGPIRSISPRTISSTPTRTFWFGISGSRSLRTRTMATWAAWKLAANTSVRFPLPYLTACRATSMCSS